VTAAQFTATANPPIVTPIQGDGTYKVTSAPVQQGGCYTWVLSTVFGNGATVPTPKTPVVDVGATVTSRGGRLHGNELVVPVVDVFASFRQAVTPARTLSVPGASKAIVVWNPAAVVGKHGTVVFAGHVTAPGVALGPLADIAQLKRGEPVIVTTARAILTTWTVTSVRTYAATAHAMHALFTRVGARRLVLLTCAGHYNTTTHRYSQILAVMATPTKG